MTITMVAVAVKTVHADVTYDVVPYDGFTTGWSMDGGTITTDGTLGPITETNLVSYSFLITSPGGSYEFTEFNGFPILFLNGGSQLIATSHAIALTASTEQSMPGSFILGSGFQSISYGSAHGSDPGFIQLFDPPTTVELNPTVTAQPYDIAVIPEPTSTLFLCGSGALIGLRRRRR